jgi:hypothetical protein
MTCGAEHPDHPGKGCEEDGSHALHLIWVATDWGGRQPSTWPNEDYVPPPRVTVVTKEALDSVRGALRTRADSARKAIGENRVAIAAEPRETSLNAALHALPKSGTKKWAIFERIAQSPITDQELALELGWSTHTTGPSRLGLLEIGVIEDSGQRRPSPHSGEPCIVWQLSGLGQEVAGVALSNRG